jgi:large subunit ribosomal protein L15
MRDIIKKLPKRRGYGKNRGRTVVPRVSSVALSLTRIDAWFETGAEVTPKTLAAKNIIARSLPPVKIVAGETTKKLTFKNCNVSATARAAIEKAGGTIA